MSQPLSFQYEFSEEITEKAVETIVNMPNIPMSRKELEGLIVLVAFTFLGGIALYFCMEMDVNWLLMLVPIALLVVFGSLLIFLLSVLSFVWIVKHCMPLARWNARRLMRKPFRDSGDWTIRWVFKDDGFEVHTANRHRESPWNELKKLRIVGEFWTLTLKGGPMLLLPRERLTPEIQDLIRRKAQENEAKVIEDTV